MLKRTRAELHVAFVDWVESAAGDRILEYEEIRGFHLEQAYEIRSELGVPDEDVETLGRRAASYLGSAGPPRPRPRRPAGRRQPAPAGGRHASAR